MRPKAPRRQGAPLAARGHSPICLRDRRTDVRLRLGSPDGRVEPFCAFGLSALFGAELSFISITREEPRGGGACLYALPRRPRPRAHRRSPFSRAKGARKIAKTH